MYSYRPLHMAMQKQGGQLEPTYSNSVRIRGVALGTYRKRWTIGRGGERGSGISVLAARQDDDDEFWRSERAEYSFIDITLMSILIWCCRTCKCTLCESNKLVSKLSLLAWNTRYYSTMCKRKVLLTTQM